MRLPIPSRRAFATLASLLAAAFSAPRTVHAQAATTVTGTVADRSGAPLAGARVSIDSARATTTAADGRFTLPVPPSTLLAVRVVREGYVLVEQIVEPLVIGETRRLTFTMVPASRIGAVAVVAAAEAPLLNVKDASIGGVVEARELNALPTAGRDVRELAFYVPGVTQATGFFNPAPILTINGSNSLYTQYFIDGLDNNEGILGGTLIDLPLSALKRLDVRSSNYGTELGRSSNGVVNYETRSGSNDFHGDAFIYGRPGGNLDARPAFVSGGANPRDYHRLQVGGSAGGALRRDRTFAFGSAEYSNDRQPLNVVTGFGTGAGARSVRQLKLFGRGDHRWSSTQSTTFRVAVSDLQQVGLGSGIVVPEADLTLRRLGGLVNATHRSTLSARTSNALSVGIAGHRWWYPPTSSSFSTPQVAVYTPGGALQAIVGSSGFQYDHKQTQLTLKNLLTSVRGSHTLTAGVDVIAGFYTLDGANSNPLGTYEVVNTGNIRPSGEFLSIRDIPANAQVRAYSVDPSLARVEGTQAVYGLFAEDAWKATEKLTLNYGLRWDYDDMTNKGESSADLTNFQPRTSFNYQLRPDRVVRGGAGLYTGKFLYTISSDAVQFGPQGGAFVTFSGAQAPAFNQAPSRAQLDAAKASLPPRELRRYFANGLENTRTIQATLGVGQQFGANWGVSIDGVYQRTRNLPRLFDLNAVNTTYGPADTVTRPVSFGDARRPVRPVTGGFRQLTTTDAGGRADYLGLTTDVQHRFNDIFTFDANWTWSHAMNDSEDINFSATQGNNFANEYADAINDRRHVVRFRSVYTPVQRLQFSAIADFQTGQPVNRLAGRLTAAGAETRDVDGSTGGFGDVYLGNQDRFPGVGRNTDRLPSSFELNLGAGYTQPLRGDTRLQLRLDAFNALNSVLYSGFANGISGGGPRTQYGRPGDPIVYNQAGRPRQIELSARLIF